MTAISEHETLALVEEGAALTPLDRGSRLLAALKQITTSEASDWSLEDRDRCLITARRAMFGPTVPFVVECTACGESTEGDLDCDALLAAEGEGEAVHGIRAPSSRDLAEAATCGDPARLARRCAPDLDLPPDVVEEHIQRAFPLLDVRIEVECHECGALIAQRFDIVRYFWSEMTRHAEQLLDETHVLARAYGWTEDEVLRLGPGRRQAYLDRILT